MNWLTFSLDGRDYKLTLDRLSIAEARAVKRYTGVTLNALVMVSAGQVDGDVLAAVVFLAQRRAGEEVDWAEIDQVDVLDLMGTMSISADEAEQGGAKATPAASNGKRPVRRTAKAAPKSSARQTPEPATSTDNVE